MIDAISSATPDTQGQHEKPHKPLARPETANVSKAVDEFEDTVELSPEALAAAHAGDSE